MEELLTEYWEIIMAVIAALALIAAKAKYAKGVKFIAAIKKFLVSRYKP